MVAGWPSCLRRLRQYAQVRLVAVISLFEAEVIAVQLSPMCSSNVVIDLVIVPILVVIVPIVIHSPSLSGRHYWKRQFYYVR